MKDIGSAVLAEGLEAALLALMHRTGQLPFVATPEGQADLLKRIDEAGEELAETLTAYLEAKAREEEQCNRSSTGSEASSPRLPPAASPRRQPKYRQKCGRPPRPSSAGG